MSNVSSSTASESVELDVANESNVSAADFELAHATTKTISKIVVLVVFPLIFVVGLVGNSMVIIVVCKNIKMHNTTNVLLVALAVADLLFVIFCVPYTAAFYVMDSWPFGDALCKLMNYFNFTMCLCSVYTLVLSKCQSGATEVIASPTAF